MRLLAHACFNPFAALASPLQRTCLESKCIQSARQTLVALHHLPRARPGRFIFHSPRHQSNSVAVGYPTTTMRCPAVVALRLYPFLSEDNVKLTPCRLPPICVWVDLFSSFFSSHFFCLFFKVSSSEPRWQTLQCSDSRWTSGRSWKQRYGTSPRTQFPDFLSCWGGVFPLGILHIAPVFSHNRQCLASITSLHTHLTQTCIICHTTPLTISLSC